MPHNPGNHDRKAAWTPPELPKWLVSMNSEGHYFDLPAVVPLDADSLINSALLKTGLNDFGEDYWREPFSILCQDLEQQAELTLMGRLMARSDIIIWLCNRLQLTDLLKQHPQILQQEIKAPVFIFGLPRSGTSILFEVLAQDPLFRVPELWESLFPCPPPEQSAYDSDPRIEQADKLLTQWHRTVPEFLTMHEMGGRIPAECGLLMAGSFISDHIASLHQAPNYAAWYAQADVTPAYEYHRKMLQVLQWKNPREHWLLKAPAHQNYLDTLLKIYPDARIIQTHRDPIKCMASATNLMGCLYLMRSNKAFDAKSFEDFLFGAATAQRLEHVMDQRSRGVIPDANIIDSRFQDLMDDPVSCVEKIYAHFEIKLNDEARVRMQDYLSKKPKGKFGVHDYEVSDDKIAERDYFRRYQKSYNVPNEV